MTKIILVGGAGFIGSHTLTECLRRGHSVHTVDDLSTGAPRNVNVAGDEASQFLNQPMTTAFIRSRIQDLMMLPGAATFREAGAIIHLAGRGHVPGSIVNPIQWGHANVDSFLATLEAARMFGVKRVVFTSSSSVLAKPRQSPYAIQKAMCEEYAGLYHRKYGIEVVVARLFNVIGTRQVVYDDGPVFPVVYGAIVHGSDVWIHGNGRQSRSFTWVVDVARELVNLATADVRDCHPGVVNLRGKTEVAIVDLPGLIADSLQIPRATLKIRYTDRRPGDVDSVSVPELDRVIELPGLEERISKIYGATPEEALRNLRAVPNVKAES